ncbi:MAG: CHAT domain-containing protein [Spirosomataceae bacterium]
MPIATVLIFYANSPEQAVLPKLAEEGNNIQYLLNGSSRKNFNVVPVSEAKTENVIKEINSPNKKVEVIHFAGHANYSQLLFGDISANGNTLAQKLKYLQTVRLVFINGCKSKGQITFFHEADIPFVIATSRAVGDEVAAWFASTFYFYLGRGDDVKKAFDQTYLDAELQHKPINFAANRGIGLLQEIENEAAVPWGLYIKPGSESENYTLPFEASAGENPTSIDHTAFLNELIFALGDIKSRYYKEVKTLSESLNKGGNVNKATKITTLLKLLPFTFGIRIRQIIAEVANRPKSYYYELMDNYALFFDTLLHHIASILMARLWDQKDTAFIFLPDSLEKISNFWKTNLLDCSSREYGLLIQSLFDWCVKAGIDAPFSIEEIIEIRRYVASADFFAASDFFYRQKRGMKNKAVGEEELIADCYLAEQTHLTKAFQSLKYGVKHVMTSVRKINVYNFRHYEVEYENEVLKVTLENPESTLLYRKSMLENRSVLCFPTEKTELEEMMEEEQKINLFPFVICPAPVRCNHLKLEGIS